MVQNIKDPKKFGVKLLKKDYTPHIVKRLGPNSSRYNTKSTQKEEEPFPLKNKKIYETYTTKVDKSYMSLTKNSQAKLKDAD